MHAVEEVSFTVARGEVLGFLGPERRRQVHHDADARPASCRRRPARRAVLGFDVVRQPIEVKRRVGYLPEGAPLYGDMTRARLPALRGRDARPRGRGRQAPRSTPRSSGPSSAKSLHRPIETLSKGFKRRVGLAQAIMHDPPVLILDEPTDGLDPNQKHGVRELIAEMASEKAIVISTHILEEVEAVCTRAVIIARGRVVADATAGRAQAALALPQRGARSRANANLLPKLRADAGRPAGRRGRSRRRARSTAVATLLRRVPRPAADRARGRRARPRATARRSTRSRVEQGRLDDVFRDLTSAAH